MLGIALDHTTDRSQARNRSFAFYVAALGILVSSMTLVGWIFHVRLLLIYIPHLPALSIPTAIAFIIASAAILSIGTATSRVSTLCAAAICAVAIGGEVDSAFRHGNIFASHIAPVGIGQFPQDVMSPITAILFVLLATAIMLLRRDSGSEQFALVPRHQILLVVIAGVALTNLLAHLFGVISLFGVSRILGMAPTTEMLFILYSAALLTTEPDRGFLLVISSDTIPGQTARRLLPVAVVAPALLGAATILALHVHAAVGLFLAFLVVVGTTLLLSVIIWNNVVALRDQVQKSEDYQKRLADVERDKMSTMLAVTKDQLALALEGAELGSWHWDLVTGHRVWSDQCKRLFGIPPEVVMSTEILLRAIHPEDRSVYLDARTRSIDANTDYRAEYRVVWPDGSIHWIYSRGRAYCGPNGKAIRFEGVSLDTTIRHAIEERQQQFLRDMLASVTDAKLMLCRDENDLPPLFAPVIEPVYITRNNSGIRDLRDAAFLACQSLNISMERCYDIKTAVGEAAMNAAVHAKCGTGQVFIDKNGTVQVKVVDQGTGIRLTDLPNATLKKGFTTAGTLGHGMKMILQTVDRIFLLTGSTGTTVILEQDLEPKEFVW